MEPDDPPPKTYGFKEREFKRDNRRSSSAPPMPTAQDLAKMSLQGAPPKPQPGLPAAALAKAGDPNDVYAVLQQNRQIAQKAGLNEVEIREVKSRRKRDFWLLLIGGNLAIVGLVVFLGANIVTLVFGLAGLVIFSLGLSWIMWQVMDRY